MKYSEILPDVLSGKWVRHTISDENPWIRMNDRGRFEDETGKEYVLRKEEYSFDWEIKEDPPEEIRISPILIDKTGHTPTVKAWITNGTVVMYQKYKLIPIEEITVQNQHEHIKGNKGFDIDAKELMSFEKWNQSELFSAHEESHKFVQGGWLKDVELRMQIADVVNRERYKAWKAALEQDKRRRGEA